MEAVFQFHYSYPFEGTVARLKEIQMTPANHEVGRIKAEVAQQIWAEHEPKVIQLFEEVYQIKVSEKGRWVWLSLVLPNSFSDPLTISLNRFPEIESNPKHRLVLVFTTIHELAHYFLYSRPEDSYAHVLWEKIKKKNPGQDRGTNLHYMIQAVEFGFGAEVLGEKFADLRRQYIAQNGHGEYQKSAQLLIDHNVPLDKTCLKFIEEKILNVK